MEEAWQHPVVNDRLSDLELLNRLRQEGAISDDEFAAEKARLLGGARFGSSRAWWTLSAIGMLLLVVVGAMLVARSMLQTPVASPRPVPSVMPSPATTGVASLLPAERLAAAVKAAFPDGPGATGKDGEHYVFDTSRLVDAPFGAVLVSEGRALDAAHVTAGRLDLAYLTPSGDRYIVGRHFPDAVEVGSFGQVGEWSVSNKVGEVPTLDAEGGFTGQGYTCAVAVLTELRPDGPAEMALIHTVYDNSGAVDDGQPVVFIKGKIANVRRGEGFDVRYSGSRTFTEHWSRRGGKYVLDGPSQMSEC